MPYCFVPGCTSSTKGIQTVKRRFFTVPTKNEVLLEKWRQSISRKDRDIDSKARVCDLHFVEEDIFKQDEFVIDGEKVVYPRTNWRLKPNAVPSIFSGLQEDQSRKRRKVGRDDQEIEAYITILSDCESSESDDEDEANDLDSIIDVALYDPAAAKVRLPSNSWNMVTGTGKNSHLLYCSEVVIMDDCPMIRKSAKIDFHSQTIEARVFKSSCPTMGRFISVETINETLKKINSSSLCCGVNTEGSNTLFGPETTWASKGAKYENGAWRSKTCLQLVESSSIRSSPRNGSKNTCTDCREWQRESFVNKKTTSRTYEKKS